MKDFVKSLGGAGWAAFLGLSAVATVVAAFNLPVYVDTTNPLVLLGAGAILFAVAFANGWKQRGFRNGRDIRLADELERERAAIREAEETKRAEIAEAGAAERARIEAEKERDLQRMREEARIDAVRRRCTACPKRKKALLLKALDGEDVLLSMMDGDATSLCDAKLMHAAPVGGITWGVKFYVHPDAVEALAEHRDAWLGSMTREERDRLIEGDPAGRDA